MIHHNRLNLLSFRAIWSMDFSFYLFPNFPPIAISLFFSIEIFGRWWRQKKKTTNKKISKPTITTHKFELIYPRSTHPNTSIRIPYKFEAVVTNTTESDGSKNWMRQKSQTVWCFSFLPTCVHIGRKKKSFFFFHFIFTRRARSKSVSKRETWWWCEFIVGIRFTWKMRVHKSYTHFGVSVRAFILAYWYLYERQNESGIKTEKQNEEEKKTNGTNERKEEHKNWVKKCWRRERGQMMRHSLQYNRTKGEQTESFFFSFVRSSSCRTSSFLLCRLDSFSSPLNGYICLSLSSE